MKEDSITVEICVEAPIEKVWRDFTDPEAVKTWNTSSSDWHTTKAENDLLVGGRFLSRMEAKDGSEGFDFTGVYTSVILYEKIAYTMDDGRKVEVSFLPDDGGVRVVEAFEPEAENSPEIQRTGWQAILDNFKKHVESSS